MKKIKKTTHYWDTSALFSVVFAEATTVQIRKYIETQNALPGYTSFFTWIEMESVISRRISEKQILTNQLPEVRKLLQELESTLVSIWPNPKLLEVSRKMVMEYGCRPGDAIQLGSAHSLKDSFEEVHFVSFDQKLNLSAASNGFLII